ncbi:MAG: HPr family phosphocarrier protein [Alphaproteobacteria bacterium]|nr:HPr family phosphocarrier protein [Alphaproteobacteria bacterium]
MTAAFEKTVQITNQRGLHARAAAKFVKLVESLDADVTVIKDNTSVTGSSIMGLLMLSASVNTQIRIVVKGPRAEQALQELVSLVERRFDEE